MKNPFVAKKKSINDVLEESVEHELTYALNDILKNSNNMAAETVFKLAGGKYVQGVGTDVAGIKMFNAFCEKKNIDSSFVKITDGSGVSKNNLLTADFVSDFLYINKDSKVMEYLPKPGEGTLIQRMLPLKEFLKAKTGTLSEVSAIAGFLTSRKGKTYVFDIMIKDAKTSSADKKNIEEQILRQIYMNY